MSCYTSLNFTLKLLFAARSGRAARKTAEELRFQKELEEAMRLSSEECSSSSQEIVPCRTSKNISVPPSSLVESETEIVPSKSSIINVTKVAEKPIVSEPKTNEVAQNYGEVVNNLLKNQSENLTKKRKVDESWVVKEKPRPKPKRVIIESSDDDDDFEDDDSEDDEEDWEEKKKSKAKARQPIKEKKKVMIKKSPVKKVSKAKEKKPCSPTPNPEGSLSPKTPLSDHNRLTAMPKCKNMFQSKNPVKLKMTPRKDEVSSKPTSVSNEVQTQSTPGLSSSLANILGKLNSKPSPSTPAGSKSSRTKESLLPSTPVQKKLPSWTPPAKVGSSSGGLGAASPSIGLRVGLSRNYRSKPLHPSSLVQK